MIIASFNSAEGHQFDGIGFAQSVLDAGLVNGKQAASLSGSLLGHDPINLHIEKIGQKLWVTLLSRRQSVWTWSIGAGGKRSEPKIDASEAGF